MYSIINRYIASMPRSMLHYYPNVGGLKHTAAPTFDIEGGGLKPVWFPRLWVVVRSVPDTITGKVL